MIRIRDGGPSDQHAIADLHARSWQVSYRGMMSDEFLDGGVLENRKQTWEKRFSQPHPGMKVILAEEGGRLLGFSCLYLEKDPVYGTLLDNLHVDKAFQRQGTGRLLMQSSAEWVVRQAPGRPLFLWVLEKNQQAIAFYEGLNGKRGERTLGPHPEVQREWVYRYCWENPSSLIEPREGKSKIE